MPLAVLADTLVVMGAALQRPGAGSGVPDWLIPILTVVLTAVLGGVFAYIAQQRAASRSALRLRADLEILEKAIALKLPDDELDALRARVRLAVAYHAQSALDGNEPALRPRPYVDTRRWPPWRRSRETVGLRRRAKAGDGASLDGGG